MFGLRMDKEERSQKQEERRRAARIPLRVPLMVEGIDLDGAVFREHAETENVSLTGACIKVAHRLAPGSILQITAVKFPFRATAAVRLAWQDEVDGVLKVGVEFTDTTQNWILR